MNKQLLASLLMALMLAAGCTLPAKPVSSSLTQIAIVGNSILTLTAAATATPSLTATSIYAGTHIVQGGETLFCIARAYSVLPQAIIDANNLSSPNPIIHPGQPLKIPRVSWVNPPPGQNCNAQFSTPVPSGNATTYTPPTVPPATRRIVVHTITPLPAPVSYTNTPLPPQPALSATSIVATLPPPATPTDTPRPFPSVTAQVTATTEVPSVKQGVPANDTPFKILGPQPTLYVVNPQATAISPTP